MLYNVFMLNDLRNNEDVYKIGMFIGWMLLIASVFIFLLQFICPEESCYWVVGFVSILVFGISLLIIFSLLLLRASRKGSEIPKSRPVLGTIIVLMSTGVLLVLTPGLSSTIILALHNGITTDYSIGLYLTPIICSALVGEYLGIKLITQGLQPSKQKRVTYSAYLFITLIILSLTVMYDSIKP